MYKNGLIRKIRSLSRFMASQPGKQTIVIYIMSNISRSKGDQTMKFGQLIKHKLRNIVLVKSFTKCVRKPITRPFSKNSNLNISLDQ